MAELYSPLNALAFVQQQGEAGRQLGQQSKLAELASQSYTAQPDQQASILSQMASVSPQAAQAQQQQFQGEEDRRNKVLANMSNLLVNAPVQARPSLYQRILPALQQMGIDAPAAYDDQSAPIIDQTAKAIYTAYAGGGIAGNVQSTYINKDGQRVAIMRDGSQKILGEADARTQLRDQPGIEPGLVDLRTGTVSPLNTGQAEQPQGAYIDPSLPPEVQQQIRAALAQGQEPPSQMTFNAGPAAMRRDPAQSITPYQQAQLANESARLGIAQQAANRADIAAQQAADAKRQVLQQKQQQQAAAVQSAVASYDDALSTIQRLRQHPGYQELGTVRGDVATWIPGVRTDAKGANAILETIKSQSLINTLSALKAASATGASGFGSLTEKEGAALQAAISNLSTAQSHADLDKALGELQRVMTRNRSMAAQRLGGNGRTVVRRGRLPDGRTVVQYSDGSTDYGN